MPLTASCDTSTAADCERVIFILPKHFVEIEEVVREFEAVTILRDNANDDKVLFDEYEVIYDDLREVIMSFTRGYTHPEEYKSNYYYRGEVVPISRKAALTDLISQYLKFPVM